MQTNTGCPCLHPWQVINCVMVVARKSIEIGQIVLREGKDKALLVSAILC